MECRACGHDNREDARFCGACGASLAPERKCPACGAANAPDHRFCDQCGSALELAPVPAGLPAPPSLPDHLAEKIRMAGPGLEGERKQVTVMFADVMGSMDLSEQVDAEQWRSIMERFFAILSEGVHRFEGTVDKFTGDGIMALFGAPIAHEDHAVRAGYAALHLHSELAGYAAELRRTLGLSFSVRIGLNSGEVVVGAIGDDLSLEYTAIGHTVGLAQRMEALAEPGATYVTDATAALMAGYLETRDLGDFEVKGARGPVRVHAITGAGSARTRLDLSAQRGFSSFVGRREEVAALEAAMRRALDGQPQVVGVVGEAGVGKSRLCHEFTELARARGIPVYHAAATAHGRMLPFSTALELLRTYFGIEERESDQAVRERVAGRLLLLDPAFADDLPLVFEFLGIGDPEQPAERMDPDARQRRLLGVVARLTHAQSRREPGVTLLEDLHWIDPGSALLLDGLMDAIPGTRALIVTNFRPEYRAEWMARSHYLQLPVVPLGPEASEALLGELLGTHPSLDGLPEEIRLRTGGNPFFIEEVVRGLAEEGVLKGERGGFRLAHPVEQVRVPPTVESVLAARIDRLDPRDKSLLQSAAVLGREFGEPVLQRVADMSAPDLASALRALTSSDFLYQQALYPEPEYAFRHPLTHEVAYGSQLGDRRARVHAAVARAIEELYPDSLDERAALLAHHWENARDPLQAVRWSARAAAWAGIRAPAEALRWWRRVAELTDDLPEDEETRSLGVLARVWILQLGWRLGMTEEESEAAFAAGMALAERSGDQVGQVLLGMAHGAAMGIRGRMTEALPLQREYVEVARSLGIPAVHMGVSLYAMYSEFVVGNPERALTLADELIELAAGDGTLGGGLAVGCPLAWVHMMRANVLIFAGRIAEATESQALGKALAIEHGDRETEGWLHLTLVWRAFATGEVARAAEDGARALELAESTGSAFSRVWALGYFGLAQLITGAPEVANEYLERANALARQERTALEGEAFQLSFLARARLACGDAQSALQAAREAVVITHERGTLGPGSFSELTLAEVLIALGPQHCDEAEAALDSAEERARAHGFEVIVARAWEARAGLAAARDDGAAEVACLREARARYAAMGAPAMTGALDERLAGASLSS